MPPAYLMRGALQAIETWNSKAVGLIEKLMEQSGRSPLAIEVRRSEVSPAKQAVGY